MEPLLQNLINDVKKNGFKPAKAVEKLKELRERYKELQQPFLVKTCRLAYEHIERNEDFTADLLEERAADDTPSFEYFLTLMADISNKYNKEELEEYNAIFLEDAE